MTSEPLASDARSAEWPQICWLLVRALGKVEDVKAVERSSRGEWEGSDKGTMAIEFSFDSVVANAGRLRILAALAREREAEFVHLREITRMTDGNLSAHARRLAEAGLISIEKKFRDEKPVTSFRITQAGKYAIKAHARELLEAVEEGDAGLDEEWID